MRARRTAVVGLAFLASTCAPQAAQKASTADAFALARRQAMALGSILGDMQVCDGEAWQHPFHDFMVAKRQRGLDGQQTAVVAALVGSAQYRSDPAMVDCSQESRAERAAALGKLRMDW